MIRAPGLLAVSDAMCKFNRTNPDRPFMNNLTIRNFEMPQELRMRLGSSDMFHAGLKSLRLYRRMCRLMPFILNIHDMNCKVTPIQAKIRAGDKFRENAKTLDVHEANDRIQTGYEVLMEFEWHYAPQTYIYKYIAPENTHQDQGRNLIDNRFDTEVNKASKFLQSFYKAKKSHVV